MKATLSKFDFLRPIAESVYLGDPTLTYHNWEHIQQTLEALHVICDCYDEATKLALLYHDIVYVPGSKHNEEMSAQVLVNHARFYGQGDADDATIQRAVRYILATKIENHLSLTFKPEDQLMGFVMDCDLIAFADSDRNRFVERQDTILAENFGYWVLHPTVDETVKLVELRQKTAAFLGKFREKHHIFHSQEFKDYHCEWTARTNIDEYITRHGV